MERIKIIEGRKKIIHTSNGDIFRQVWKVENENRYKIQYKNDMPEVIREVINNIEIFRLKE